MRKYIFLAVLALCALTFLAFLGLKLIHFIDWAWLWITSPLWIPAVIFVLFLIGCLLAAFMIGGKFDREEDDLL